VHLAYEAVLAGVGPQGAHAGDSLAEVRVDRRLGDGVHARQLPGRGNKVALNECVDEEDGRQEDEDVRRGVGDDYQRVEDVGQAEDADFERVGYAALERLDVLAEAVGDAADGRGLEEVHRGPEDGREEFIVKESGAFDEHDHQEYVGYGQQEALQQADAQVDREPEVLVVLGLDGVYGVVGPFAKPEGAGGQGHYAGGEEREEYAGERDAACLDVVGQDGQLDAAGEGGVFVDYLVLTD